MSPSAPKTLPVEEMETRTLRMRRAERRVPRQESGLVQCPLRDPPPGAKMLRVSAAKPAKAPSRGQSGGCPGSRPEAGRGRSSRRDAAVSCFNVSRGDQNDGPHDRLALHKDITPPLEPRPGGPAVDAAPASKALLWLET